MMIGVFLPAKERLVAAGFAPAQPFEPNAFLAISPDNSVVVTVAKSEMGQHVRTSIPMIVADELGADWSRVQVAQADAQTGEEAEVEAFVSDRRVKRAEIRSQLVRKRRMELAERRASKARAWSAVEDGEDLAALLKDPNHGLTVLEEPEEADSSKPQGVSYIRIDDGRILKIRMPLEMSAKETRSKASEEPSEVPMSPPDGMPPPPGMPPMPPPPGMPPMPPPVTKDE